MELEIKEGAALNDAQDLKTVVSHLRAATEELSNIMKQIVTSNLSLDWADVVKGNWDNFANTNMEEVFSSITNGASSLEAAVKAAIEYSTESR